MKPVLRSVAEILPDTRVAVRLDLDLPIGDNQIMDNSRLVKSLPTLKLLLEKNCHLLILGHRDRPEGVDITYSLKPVYLELLSLFEDDNQAPGSIFIDDVNSQDPIDLALANNRIVFLENLRFWPGETGNDPKFLSFLPQICQAYVNDALAVAHRSHASIMLHRKLPAFYGLGFIDEIDKLDSIIASASHPVTLILAGAKADKLSYLPRLANFADYILIGGKLPQLLSEEIRTLISRDVNHFLVAKLTAYTFDISPDSIDKFIQIISQSKTIIWVGSLGFYEDSRYRAGSQAVARAVAATAAKKIIAGGDTVAALKDLGLVNQVDVVSSGGGMLLEYLIKGSLAAWS